MGDSNNFRSGLDVAIIGMVGRFPGANKVDKFFRNLKEGKSSISFFTDEELIGNGVSKKDVEKSHYVKAKGIIEDGECFDSNFFDYTPNEAKIMDPQMRLMHECIWEALEDAGYDHETYEGLIGVYVGGTPNPLWETLTFLADEDRVLNPFIKSLLNDKDLMATRVSYKLNLRGPSVSFFTSCSTSLVAIHTAVQALLSGECDIAVAGGISATYPQKAGYEYQQGMHLSPDGYCRSFDANANGLVISDAVGLVVLKRAEDAVKDKDSIDALIIGSAINNDGNRKVSYAAPSVDGQEEVIRIAQSLAEIEPEDVGYIEAHGSGTTLGDNIEIEALKRVFSNKGTPYCALGTAKANIGHTNSAAGAVGVIKATLGLKHRLIFPHINFKTPHPELDLENSPFYIANKLMEFKNDDKPLIAGISSFGVGGTNAHLIIKEPPIIEYTKVGTNEQVIILSAKTILALERQKEQLTDFLKQNNTVNFEDLAYTLQAGRCKFDYRLALASNSVENALAILEDDKSRGVWKNKKESNPKIIFMFSGQGKQYWNMGIDLYNNEPYFKSEMDRCLKIAKKYSGVDYKEYLYGNKEEQQNSNNISSTDIVQPLLFCFEYAVGKLLMELGIQPKGMIGYSFGEFTAACLAGIMELEEAIKVVIIRGKLMKKSYVGAMISVPLSQEKVKNIIGDNLSIAIDNGETCIVSGLKENIDELQLRLKDMKIMCIPLNGEHAAHSTLLKDVAEEFYNMIHDIDLRKPQIPVISCVSGKEITDNEAVSKIYWAEHMLKTIKYYDGVKNLVNEENYIFIEIGPGRDLSNIVQRCSNEKIHTVDLIKTKASGVSDMEIFFNRLGYLWTLGVEIQWEKLHLDQGCKRVHLPTYPFEKHCYAFNKSVSDLKIKELNTSQNITQKKPNISEWFYLPSWKRVELEKKEDLEVGSSSCWLLLSGKSSLGSILEKNIVKMGQSIIWVEPGEKFECVNNNHYRINIEDADNYLQLIEMLNAQEIIPEHIISLLPTQLDIQIQTKWSKAENASKRGVYSILHLLKALQRSNYSNQIKIIIVTSSIQTVMGDEILNPEYGTLLGTIKVINQEYVNIECCNIDIQNPREHSHEEKLLAMKLLEEFKFELGASEIAYRGRYRWIKVYEHFDIGQTNGKCNTLKHGGTYVITGGLGRIGYEIACHLSKKYKAKIAIITKNYPDQSLENYEKSDLNKNFATKIEKVMKLRSLGPVLVNVADVSDLQQMKKAFEDIENEFGKINGVINAVGITGRETSKAMSEVSIDDFEIQFKPKVHGTYVLEELLANRDIDFCILCSSLSTILGGLGYGAYAAGNSFLDTFIYEHNRVSAQQWINVNWETWNKGEIIDITMPALGSFNTQLEMSSEDGVEVFERILTWVGSDQIVVSSGALEERVERWVDLREIKAESIQIYNGDESAQNRPQLLNEYIEPQTNIEKRLSIIWKKILGLNSIGVQDDFLELGGDSLKLLNAISWIYKEFNIDISVSEFFNNPTIEYVAKKIECGSEKSQLTIPHVDKKEYYALSSAQKRIYYLQSMDKKGTTYNETTVFILEGEVDRTKIKDAFKRIIERHEILRTSFDMVNNEPIQVIHEQIEFSIEYSEANDIDKSIQEFIRYFDLRRTPLIRIGLVKIDENRHVMILDMNHIITDGVSESILIKEFMALYNNNNSSILDLEIQYKDFAEWQFYQRGKVRLEKQERYWLDKYADGITKLDLPYDFNRPTIKTFAGKSIEFTLNDKMTTALKVLSQQEAITLNMLITSAFVVFLNKVSGEDDIVVGTNSAGRIHPETQNIIGMFVNTLALRLQIKKEQSIKQLLQEVKQEIIQSFENQDYQFDDLVEKLINNRDFSRNPIFDVLFVWQNIDIANIEAKGLKFIPYEFNDRSSKFDLTLMGYEIGSEIMFKIEYSTDIFKESTILRFIEYFKKVMKDIVSNPEQLVSEIDIMSDEEKHRLLYEFNDTKAEYPSDKKIYELFEEQVEKNPENIAVVYEDSKLTYRELNEKTNSLANVLRAKGVKPDSIVGIMVERSLEMMIGIMGILKAGGAYVPIDPEYPQERIEYMLEDSNAKILLTQNHLMDKVKFKGNVVDLEDEELYKESKDNLDKVNISSDLAYVIYTSGSTGKPKGVMIEHKAIINRLNWMQKKYTLNNEDVILQKTTYTFDVSVWELFWWSLVGAKLRILPKGEEKDPQAIVNNIKKGNITVIHFVPSMFNIFMEHVVKQNKYYDIKTLKIVFSSGEALKKGQSNIFNQKIAKQNNTRLINLYGPTEAAIDVTYYECKIEEEKEVIPIGKPIDNIRMYIVDKSNNLLLSGVTGELCISGVGLARGYINNEKLTAEKFVENPFEPGERMYKTGDIARWLSDGNIEFIGRIDHQVKIRGFRIELAEIENQLLKNEGIKEAIAVDKEDKYGNRYICAYLVCDRKMTITELRGYLLKELPEYMIPAYFMQIEKLPLTPNGKIDRKALPKPELINMSTYVKPCNQVELELTKVWSNVFDISEETISIEQNFFEAGGNSINLVQMSTQIEASFGLDIPIALFFQYTNIKAMAEYIKKMQNTYVDNYEKTEQSEENRYSKKRLMDRKKRTRG